MCSDYAGPERALSRPAETASESASAEPVLLPTPRANVVVTPLPSGKRRISVQKLDDSLAVPLASWDTDYDLDLIRLILDVKGPGALCDEIARDESPEYTGAALNWALLSYMGNEQFAGRKILDFGCGSGASTVTLCRMFPTATIVGVDIGEGILSIARARARFYGLSNVEFAHCTDPTRLPPGLGDFDHVILCAVYEHLLPQERISLLPQLWGALKVGGVLFLRETPHRYFPIETHTTGLPLINYLPDRIAHQAAKLSRRWNHEKTWEQLLRAGIRGATLSEIEGVLSGCDGSVRVLQPHRLGVEDRIDLWFVTAEKSRHSGAKRAIYRALKQLKRVSGFEFAPYLELALRKQSAAISA